MTKEQLKKWRLKHGLSQTRAGEEVAYSAMRTWQHWEAGDRRIPNYLPALLKFYELQNSY